jgi:uncharacterized protein YbjT (DUF2867 family)
MIGQGVLRECLLDPEVTSVLSVGRSSVGQQNDKLRELVCKDLFQLDPIKPLFSDYDACLFCLGVSSAGMTESDYSHVTYDLTIYVAKILVQLNPGMTFIYISGMGADSTEKGRIMWARVKGKTENTLLGLPFKAAYMFRPGLIQPMHGIKSKTRSYRIMYAIMSPIVPLLTAAFPKYVTTTEKLALAMINAAKHGAQDPIIETRDIKALSS